MSNLYKNLSINIAVDFSDFSVNFIYSSCIAIGVLYIEMIMLCPFTVKMCDVSNIKSHANNSNANVACGNKFWGIHGERCNMTCKGVDQSMNAENKNVHVTCETDEEDNAEWKWYAEDGGSDDAPEAIEPPDCERKILPSRKHLRTKVSPDLHLIYSKNGGNLGLVLNDRIRNFLHKIICCGYL